ncbi:MAG TPA: 50S ribosomal protein L17 [Verrucomicrobiae bacterium]|nr:50S ribosomal protein L17 [Verrucomicrobiae bacterium]
MRHRVNSLKLGRTSQHRDMMLAALVVSLIKYNRIRTTEAKAKAARRLAEKMVTLGKRGDIAARRLAAAKLRDELAVRKLFGVVAPAFASRQGGYTRVTKLLFRQSDAAPMAMVEWTEAIASAGKKESAAEEVASDKKA